MRINQKILQVLAAIVFASAAVTAQATPQTGYFIYDEAGHLIGEYDANGNAIQEHIYLGDRPVAVVQGQTGSVGYVTADQLNTPRAITAQNATLEWSWTSDPFGNGQPTGSLTYNLRFPGQYYDAETGHSYNYARDYDMTTGRYIESDPVGLKGGINVYVYVRDNPLLWIDSYGLCPDCRKGCRDTYKKDVYQGLLVYQILSTDSCGLLHDYLNVAAGIKCQDGLNTLYEEQKQYYLRKLNSCLWSCFVQDEFPGK